MACLLLIACHGGGTATVDGATADGPAIDASGDALTTAPSCTDVDPMVAVPTAPHGLYVFQPGSPPPSYVLDNKLVCGGNFFVDWSRVDTGTGSYDWSSVEAQIKPWAMVGKKANLLVEAVGFAKTNTTTPGYVLGQVPTVSCTQTSSVPVFWNATYKSLYQAFIAAVVAKYGADPRIGYIRFGMSNGAQSGTTVCYAELVTAGLTIPVWESYIDAMATFEAGLSHSVQLMLALGPYGTMADPTFPDWEADTAVSLGLGIGNQGLQASDLTNYNAVPKMPCRGGDWCANFTNPAHIGKVPFYLQQIGLSCPAGGCSTGPLTTLLPFAAGMNTQIFEIYLEDFGVAYDSGNANHAAYGAAYDQLFQTLAAKLGAAQ